MPPSNKSAPVTKEPHLPLFEPPPREPDRGKSRRNRPAPCRVAPSAATGSLGGPSLPLRAVDPIRRLGPWRAGRQLLCRTDGGSEPVRVWGLARERGAA